MTDEAAGQDGRVERGRLTRVKIADAVLSLLDEGESHLPAEKVAKRAGVSRRLVFHHFDHMPQLVDAAVARRMEQLRRQIRPLPQSGSREERVAALGEQRSRILEWITPARLAVMRINPESEQIQAATHDVLALARRNLTEIFAAELDPVPEPRKTQLVDTLHAATTWGAWYHWRHMTGLDPGAARDAMEAAIHLLLETTDT
ncbi:TetR/AcrR family transcriptional regulator [Streptomyces sp. NPDC048419]|uniref:TetR/AcrR family transcriptional regulator n=1 Tax=Streptomyces sp. NPDC048419 TaxID=3365547 RepID=UPI0037231AF2